MKIKILILLIFTFFAGCEKSENFNYVVVTVTGTVQVAKYDFDNSKWGETLEGKQGTTHQSFSTAEGGRFIFTEVQETLRCRLISTLPKLWFISNVEIKKSLFFRKMLYPRD